MRHFLSAILLGLPGALQACAVCFGKTDNLNLGKAFNWGILILLAFTFSILAVLILTMYKIEKRRAP